MQALTAWGENSLKMDKREKAKGKLEEASSLCEEPAAKARLALRLGRICEDGGDAKKAAAQYAFVMEHRRGEVPTRNLPRHLREQRASSYHCYVSGWALMNLWKSPS